MKDALVTHLPKVLSFLGATAVFVLKKVGWLDGDAAIILLGLALPVANALPGRVGDRDPKPENAGRVA